MSIFNSNFVRFKLINEAALILELQIFLVETVSGFFKHFLVQKSDLFQSPPGYKLALSKHLEGNGSFWLLVSESYASRLFENFN